MSSSRFLLSIQRHSENLLRATRHMMLHEETGKAGSRPQQGQPSWTA